MKLSYLHLCRAVPLLAVGMSLLPSIAHAQVTKTGDAYQFRVKYHKGMKIDYVMQVNTALPSNTSGASKQNMVLAIPVSGTVTDVQQGIATVKMTSGPATMNGKPQGAAREFEMKMDSHGKAVGAPIPGMEGINSNLPETPLKVGESFTRKQSLVLASIPINVNAQSKFLGIKTFNGQRCAEFSVTVKGTGTLPSSQGGGGQFSMQGGGSLEISVADGLMVHSTVDQVVTIPQGTQSMHLNTKTVMDRK